MATATDALGEITTPTYDADAKTIETSFSNDGGLTPSETLTFDPDGRVRTVTSSSMGEQSTTYDADGKVTAVQEPSGGSLTSPATYTYGYYADGQRANLSVNSSALAQSNMLQYAYRNDGLRSKLAFAYETNSASWAWTRTDAGRVTSLADSSGQAAHTTTYDAYGRVSGDTMPSGAMTGLTYDDEGDVSGFTYPTANAMSINYTIRGEITTQFYAAGHTCAGSPDPLAPLYQKSANGFMVAYEPTSCDPAGGPTITWDQRTGAALQTQSDDSSGTGTGYAYDAAGRQNSGEQDWSYTRQCGDLPCTRSGEGTQTRTYDAQNHLLGETISQWSDAGSGLNGCYLGGIMPLNLKSKTVAYAWGPNGHPDLWTGRAASPLTVHWDGNTPLFVTNSDGSLAEIKIEGLGYYAAAATHPMTFLDRNPAGFVVAAHWSGGSSAWQPENAYHQMCSNQDLSGYVLYEPGSDGISDGVNTIQGVRDFDPALATWTSPDAYAGDASDPMSRKSYMWNRNNSYAYSDPTGYMTVMIDILTFDEVKGDATAIYKFFLGDDINTLRDPQSSGVARGMAIVGLGLNFAGDGSGKLLEKAGGGLAEHFGPGVANNIVSILKTSGVRGLKKSISSWSKQLARHLQKIADAKAAGGYTSSMEKEVRNFQASIEAAQEAIRNLTNSEETAGGAR